MWISDALFEQTRFSFDNLTHVIFWTKGEIFYKHLLKKVGPQITIPESTKSRREKLIFSLLTQNQLQIHDGIQNRLNTLLHQLLGGIIRGTNKYTLFI